jgi:hypothetical protein
MRNSVSLLHGDETAGPQILRRLFAGGAWSA